MERLTEKISGRNVIPLRKSSAAHWELCEVNGENGKEYRVYGKYADKLAEYENLEEQCIKENSFGFKMLLEKWKEFIDDIQELYEYRKLEEQNLLLKLPCAVGDTVYELQEIRHRIQPLEIISVHIGRMGEPYFYWELEDGIGIYKNVRGFGQYQIGKTVFLTREEAEAALKELNAESPPLP